MTSSDNKSANSVAKLHSVAEIVNRWLPGHGRRTAIRFDNGASYSSVKYDAYLEDAHRMIAYFQDQGAEQRVITTLVKNRPEWDMTAFGALYTANVLSPLDTKMDDEELRHLLRLCPPDYLLVSVAQLPRLRRILGEVELKPRVLIADLYDVFEDAEAGATGQLDENETLMSSIPWPSPDDPLPEPSPLLESSETVLAHYATSGTTNLPKIVRITHGNIVAQLREAQGVINLRRKEDLLNIGPYTHIATLLEFLVAKSKGFTVTYVTREVDDDGVLEDEIKKLKRQGVRVKALMAVPKFWVYVMKEVLEEMKDKPVLHNLYLYLTSIEKNARLHDIGTVDKAKLIAVRRSFKNKMGGHFSYGISSSSKIDPGVIEIFAMLGVTVIDIYGATEASGIIARNKLNESRRGSCGRLLEGLEAKLSGLRSIPGADRPVGELRVKGSTVCKGYVGQDPASHLDDQGFYRTGDLASIDEDNYVYLVGRRAELIRWEDGTYVDPMHLSNLLVRSIWIKDALVTRLGQDTFLSVFIFLDHKRLQKDGQYLERIALGLDHEQALWPLLEQAVAHAQSLAQITPRLSTERIYLLDRKLERTPTHKIKLGRELARLDLTHFVSKDPPTHHRRARQASITIECRPAAPEARPLLARPPTVQLASAPQVGIDSDHANQDEIRNLSGGHGRPRPL
jgi:long-subunit acyl-CoA synthetase (AMP-forming)